MDAQASFTTTNATNIMTETHSENPNDSTHTNRGWSYAKSQEYYSVEFPYIPYLPDQLWPLAFEAEFGATKLGLDSRPFDRYGFENRIERLDRIGRPAIAVLPESWLSKEPFANTMKPIMATHLYQGYRMFGLAGCKLSSLERTERQHDGASFTNLFRLLLEMRYAGVIGGKSDRKNIACWSEPGRDFVQLMLEIAQADSCSKGMLDGISAMDDVAELRQHTRTFLEPLWDVGTLRFDFVVGNGLTSLAAAQQSDRYRAFASYQSLKGLAFDLPPSPVRESIVSGVLKLREPVLITANRHLDEACFASIRKVAEKAQGIMSMATRDRSPRFNVIANRLETYRGEEIGRGKLDKGWNDLYCFDSAQVRQRIG